MQISQSRPERWALTSDQSRRDKEDLARRVLDAERRLHLLTVNTDVVEIAGQRRQNPVGR